jgi:hypothetical protein
MEQEEREASTGDRNYTAMRTHVQTKKWNKKKEKRRQVTEITQPCIHTCNGLFICQLYLLPDLLEETDCKEDTPLTLPFASFVSLSQLIIVI